MSRNYAVSRCALAWVAKRTSDLPDNLHWLGDDERRELSLLSDPSRRQHWLCGRLAAKELLAKSQPLTDVAQLQVLTRDAAGKSIRPRIFVTGKEVSASVSISHDGEFAIAATGGRQRIGVDIVPQYQFSGRFMSTWFTPREQSWLRDETHETQRSAWALKEAVYKAINNGESFAPLSIEVSANGTSASDREWHAWYRGKRLYGLHLQFERIDSNSFAVATLGKRSALFEQDNIWIAS